MRPWIVSLVATVAVLGAVFVIFPGDGERSPPPRRKTARPLTEADIRLYMTLAPQIFEVLVTTEPDETPRAVETLLAEHHLDRRAWEGIRNRVEIAVGCVRLERGLDRRLRAIDERIRTQEKALPEARGPTVRRQIQDRISELNARRHELLNAAPAADRELAKRFWAGLNQIVPQTLGSGGG